MAVTGRLYKIVFGGALALTETWSIGFHFLTPGEEFQGDALLRSGFHQWLERQDSRVSSIAKWEYTKINEINPVTGKYLDESLSNTIFETPLVSGVVGPSPPQSTVAVSLVTGAERGYASKGRFFPPVGALDVNMDTSGRVGAPFAQGIALSAAQLITDMNGSEAGDVVVFSKVGQITRPVTGVRVGRVVDTQQRRRKNLLEDYQFNSIA